MELFKYQSFHVIMKFLKNRNIIFWCTKLMRSNADERMNIEVAMWEKGVGWILRELVLKFDYVDSLITRLTTE